MDELYASARMYRQSEQFEKLDKLMSEHEAEFGNYELVNAINTRLREIAKRISRSAVEKKDSKKARTLIRQLE